MNPRARRRWAWGLGAIGGLVRLAAIAAALSGLPAHAPGSASLPEGSGPTGATIRPTGGSAPSTPSGSPAPNPIPPFGHIFLIVMENKAYDSVIGNGAALFINGLAARYALATAYAGVTHPSEPNYFALWSGSTQGVTNDGRHDFSTGMTLGDEVLASGRSWHVAAQNVPSGCFTGTTASGGEDGPGTYARKHEPAISWTSVSSDPTACARITDLSHFRPNEGNLWLIVPNLCNDMHDCSVAMGDAFLRSLVPTILASPAFANGVVFLTWDEGSGSTGGGGRVPTLVISPLVRPGARSTVAHDHYSLLRTIEDGWSLPCLANACRANDLSELFE